MNGESIYSYGGNVGKIAEAFKSAIKDMNDKIGKGVQKSSLYETDLCYKEKQAFLNRWFVLNRN